MHPEGILNLFHLPFSLTLYQLSRLAPTWKTQSDVHGLMHRLMQIPEDALKLAVSEHSPGSPCTALASGLKDCIPAWMKHTPCNFACSRISACAKRALLDLLKSWGWLMNPWREIRNKLRVRFLLILHSHGASSQGFFFMLCAVQKQNCPCPQSCANCTYHYTVYQQLYCLQNIPWCR